MSVDLLRDWITGTRERWNQKVTFGFTRPQSLRVIITVELLLWFQLNFFYLWLYGHLLLSYHDCNKTCIYIDTSLVSWHTAKDQQRFTLLVQLQITLFDFHCLVHNLCIAFDLCFPICQIEDFIWIIISWRLLLLSSNNSEIENMGKQGSHSPRWFFLFSLI